MIVTNYIDSKGLEYAFLIIKREFGFEVKANIFINKIDYYDVHMVDFFFPSEIKRLSITYPEAANYISKYIKNICFL